MPGSSGRPPEVHGEGRARKQIFPGPQQKGDDIGHLIGLGEPLDGMRGEDDFFQDALLRDTVGLGLRRDLALHQRRPDEGGADRHGGDAGLGTLQGEHPHQAEHSVLRGDVARIERGGHQ
jgi:hypothetical protein